MDHIDESSNINLSTKNEITNNKIDSSKKSYISKNGIRATGKIIKDRKNSSDISKAIEVTPQSESVDENKNQNTDLRMLLRPKRTILSYFSKKVEPESDDELFPMKNKIKNESDEDYKSKPRKCIKNNRERKVLHKEETLENDAIEYTNEHIEQALDKIPKNKKALKKLYDKLQERIYHYRSLFIKEQKELLSNFY